MATRSGLIALVNGVREWFAANTVAPATVPNVAACGWKQRGQQVNEGPGGANRVLFIPGDMQGRGGKLVQPRIVSTNPRPLLEWQKIVTLSVWAVDNTDRNNEEKQIEAVESLLERTIQAIRYAQDPATGQSVGLANIEWAANGELTWVIDNTEMYFGREVQVAFVHRGPLYDVTYDTCSPAPALTTNMQVP